MTIKTLNGEVTNKSSVISGMKVASSRNSCEDWPELPDTYTKKYLPVGKEGFATLSKLKTGGIQTESWTRSMKMTTYMWDY